MDRWGLEVWTAMANGAAFQSNNLEPGRRQLFRKNGAGESDPDDDHIDFFEGLRHGSIPFPHRVHGTRGRTVADTQWFATQLDAVLVDQVVVVRIGPWES